VSIRTWFYSSVCSQFVTFVPTTNHPPCSTSIRIGWCRGSLAADLRISVFRHRALGHVVADALLGWGIHRYPWDTMYVDGDNAYNCKYTRAIPPATIAGRNQRCLLDCKCETSFNGPPFVSHANPCSSSQSCGTHWWNLSDSSKSTTLSCPDVDMTMFRGSRS
jgi:hypothetical protein